MEKGGGWDPSFTFIEIICFLIWWGVGKGGCFSFIVCHKRAGNVFNTSISNARDLLGCWVHQVHLQFIGPGALIVSFAASVWLKSMMYVTVSCIFLLF